MPDWLSIHEPVLINTIGHAAGAVIFGILLYFLVAGRQRAWLPTFASALAMLWNVGSLVTLAAGPKEGRLADIAAAASFSVLSLLPAVLLHISLGRRQKVIPALGYLVSGAAVILHVADVITGALRFHYAALLLVTIGFGALTAISVILEWRRNDGAAGSRLAAAMGLFLFAISFAHFEEAHAGLIWTRELAFHHAGIPLALFILLQDYRFLLLDAFLRFLVNGMLAAAAVLVAIPVLRSSLIRGHLHDPFPAGLLFVGSVILLAVFVWLRNRLDQFLTRVVFLRADSDAALARLNRDVLTAPDSNTYLETAAQTIADFMRASRFELQRLDPSARGSHAGPAPVLESGAWARAVLPLHLSPGEDHHLLLGPREGGRRYLSEDLAILARLGAAAVEQVKQLRARRLEDLASQAELRALQAQINPHFLFNALNTLYGTIDRANTAARRLVLNLSDVFRYLLRSERTIVEVEEELRIVRAYLAIEELRLGSKLRCVIDVDSNALQASIPLLSIQPLIENAVRHGIAARGEPGFVRLEIRRGDDSLIVRISNSGECDPACLSDSSGIGLTNVRRRLELCYGAESLFEASVAEGVTTVGFVLPARPAGAGVMTLRTLIVDDEPIARQVLREELAEIPDIELIGEADGGARAIAMIEERAPDLVLLDLQMPEVGGFDVIRRIGSGRRPPLLIIVTAWDQHALDAFNAGAIDYLLKPVRQERLAQSIERARRASGREAAEQLAKLQEIGDGTGAPKRIVGRAGEEYFLLPVVEIFAFEADGDLVWIHTAKRRYLATQTLRALEQRLAGANFRRIHRGALVNVNHVRKMSPLTSQRWLITLGNNQEFIVSKRQAGSVRELLS